MRERLVTRTISETTVTVLGLDVSQGKAVTNIFTIAGEHNAESALKVIKKQYEDDNYKPVSVVSYNVDEKLYGMTEQEFIEHAKILPPRKIYGAEE